VFKFPSSVFKPELTVTGTVTPGGESRLKRPAVASQSPAERRSL